jgi:hypothetical protein
MRLMRSTPLILGLVGCLWGASAQAADPRDPFATRGATQQAAPEPRPDPFAAPSSGAPVTEAKVGLKDPFSIRAPECPVRTTDQGVVIQRPTNTDCRPAPNTSSLRDPWGA